MAMVEKIYILAGWNRLNMTLQDGKRPHFQYREVIALEGQ